MQFYQFIHQFVYCSIFWTTTIFLKETNTPGRHESPLTKLPSTLSMKFCTGKWSSHWWEAVQHVYQQMRLTSWLNLLSGISSGSVSIRLGVSVLRCRVWKTFPNAPREVSKMFILPLNLIALQGFFVFHVCQD